MQSSATIIPLDKSAAAPGPSRDVLKIADLVHTYANGVRALDGVTLTCRAACTACSAPTAPASRP